MDEIHKKYDKVTVITICTDKPRNKMDAKAFLKSNRFSFVSLFDPQSTVKKMLNVTNIPHSFIVAPDGEIIYEHTGYQRGDEKHYEEVIDKWLETQEKPVEKMDEKEPGCGMTTDCQKATEEGCETKTKTETQVKETEAAQDK